MRMTHEPRVQLNNGSRVESARIQRVKVNFLVKINKSITP